MKGVKTLSNLEFDLTGRIALVTGGSSGIGHEIAKTLARKGARVVISNRRKEEGEKAARVIAEMRGEAIAIPADVSQKKSVEEMVQKALKQFGRIDILVNSAGINIRKPALDFEESDWDQVIDINLKGTFLTCQAVGRIMVEQKRGKIINISSSVEKIGMEMRIAYCASKGGISQLTKSLAIEWAPYGVNVNAVGPGFTRTALLAKLIEQDPTFIPMVQKRVPLGRLGLPEEVASVVLLLASDAGDYITGQTYFVDGGWTIL
jgi:2-deoxy-D-gluconate 3-dehydrogenase